MTDYPPIEILPEEVMERAYTISEIDAMRIAVRDLILAQHDNTLDTESRLRTYMMAGVGLAEIEEAVSAARDADEARMIAKMKERNPGCIVRFTNWRGEEITA